MMPDYPTEIQREIDLNQSSQWKILREKIDSESFTSLRTYLQKIYPDNEFAYDAIIPSEIRRSRGIDDRLSRCRPDARCEDLNLIVEYDGPQHYQDFRVATMDHLKDQEWRSAGYLVVRIPFWIQLSREYILDRFRVDPGEEMCEFTFSFATSDPVDGAFNLPISFCEPGIRRFCREFDSLPYYLQNLVRIDMRETVRMSQYVDSYSPDLMGI